MVYIDGENEEDPILFTTRIVPRDRPLDYNYDYGLEMLLNAVWYLVRRYGWSQEAQAIDLLVQVSRTVPISLRFDLPDRRP